MILKCRRQWSLYWFGFAWQGFGGRGTAGVAPLRSCQKPPPSLFVACNGIKCFILHLSTRFFFLFINFTAMNILSLLTLNKIKSSSSGQLPELTFNHWHYPLFWRCLNSGRNSSSAQFEISPLQGTFCTGEVPSAALPEEHTDLLGPTCKSLV